MLVLQPTHHQFVTILRYQTLQSLFKQDYVEVLTLTIAFTLHYSSPLCLANCFGHNNNAQTASFKTYALKSCACSLYKRSHEQPKVEVEAQFWNRSSILKWKLNFEIEVQFWNQSSILKLKFHSEIKAPFCNRSFILKIEVWFWNRGSILKLKLDFEIEAWFENRSLTH